jgi:hypothetical protein
MAVNFRYCSLVLFYKLLFLTLALNIWEEGHAGCWFVLQQVNKCGDTCSYTRYIVSNSKREKDKAIQPLQGKDFSVTNPQIQVITVGRQSSSWPSQWEKETLAFNNQLGRAWWKQHMKADFSSSILPGSGSVTKYPKFNPTPWHGVMSTNTMQPKHLLTLHTHAPPTSLFGHIWSNTFSSWAITVMW